MKDMVVVANLLRVVQVDNWGAQPSLPFHLRLLFLHRCGSPQRRLLRGGRESLIDWPGRPGRCLVYTTTSLGRQALLHRPRLHSSLPDDELNELLLDDDELDDELDDDNDELDKDDLLDDLNDELLLVCLASEEDFEIFAG